MRKEKDQGHGCGVGAKCVTKGSGTLTRGEGPHMRAGKMQIRVPSTYDVVEMSSVSLFGSRFSVFVERTKEVGCFSSIKALTPNP